MTWRCNSAADTQWNNSQKSDRQRREMHDETMKELRDKEKNAEARSERRRMRLQMVL